MATKSTELELVQTMRVEEEHVNSHLARWMEAVHEARAVLLTNAYSKGELKAASRGVPWPLAIPGIPSPGGDAHLLSKKEGSSDTDAHDQTPYSCNDSSCSSRENAATKPTELELAATCGIIDENPSQSQAMERMADLQSHNLRRHRSSLAKTKPNCENAQEGARGRCALSRPWRSDIPRRRATAGTMTETTVLSTPPWTTRDSWRKSSMRGGKQNGA